MTTMEIKKKHDLRKLFSTPLVHDILSANEPTPPWIDRMTDRSELPLLL